MNVLILGNIKNKITLFVVLNVERVVGLCDIRSMREKISLIVAFWGCESRRNIEDGE